MASKYEILLASSGWGAPNYLTELGPEALLQGGLSELLREEKIPFKISDPIYPILRGHEAKIAMKFRLKLINDFNQKLANKVQKSLSEGYFPIILGGDHSIAAGSWYGYSHYCHEPFGLIWFDAHMDAHTAATSESGSWHGMPLAALLGHGELFQNENEPAIIPSNVFLIGTRSFEQGEANFLKLKNVRIYTMEEVNSRGLKNIIEDVLSLTSHLKTLVVSLDLDVIDPLEAPGVGTKDVGGISSKDLISSLSDINRTEKLKAFELAEYNPYEDLNNQTLRLSYEIIKKIVSSTYNKT